MKHARLTLDPARHFEDNWSIRLEVIGSLSGAGEDQ
jgi:hypothetical protein